MGKLIVRPSTGAEKRRVCALSPYYETKTKTLLEPGFAHGGSEDRDVEEEYPECGEDEDMDEPINTDEARDSLVRDDWFSNGQESVEFTGGIYEPQISFIFDISTHSQELFRPTNQDAGMRSP